MEPKPRPRRRSALGRILVAAIVGMSNALGWDKAPSEEIVSLAPGLSTGDLDLEFGDLDPLD